MQFVLTSWKLQASTTATAIPSSLGMKHVAHRTTRKQKYKAQSGDVQTHLHRGSFVPSLRKQNKTKNYSSLFFGPCIFNNEDKNKPTKCTN